MMQKLSRDQLLQSRAICRGTPDEFREKVLEHKRNRRLDLGTNAALYFEDRLTMQYQVQEMLRIERIFEADGINEELEAYNPLIPDGSNWKATFMVEFPEEEERRAMLTQLVGIEKISCTCRSPISTGFSRLPMKIWNALMRPKPRPCISCVSN